MLVVISSIWLIKVGTPAFMLSIMCDALKRISFSLMANALNLGKYIIANTNVTICDITVAAAAPLIPHPNGYMKSQSNPTFNAAPTTLYSIE